MIRIYPGLVLALCCLALPTQKAVARPAEIILLRHAEKPADPNDVHLSPLGEERARALASYLVTTPALTNAGLPTVLFATGWTRHNHSRRPFETLQPLAK